MNPQPNESIGVVFAILFVCGIAYYAYKAFVNGPHIDLRNIDLFTVGYIEPNNIRVKVNHIHVPQQQVKKYDTQFYLDCVEALYSLGMKKAQAKKITKSVFESNNPSSIQEFLVLALKK